MSSNLHPLFAGILSTIQTAPRDLRRIQEPTYVEMLCTHDWEFQYGDDGALLKGRAELDALIAAQRAIDPGYLVWNIHAPEGYRKGQRLKSAEHPSIARAVRDCM